MEASAGQLRSAVAVLDRKVAAARAWSGADARRFRAAWDGSHRPSMLRAASRLQQAANDLRRNAEEQERASAGGASTSVGHGFSGGGGGGGGGGGWGGSPSQLADAIRLAAGFGTFLTTPLAGQKSFDAGPLGTAFLSGEVGLDGTEKVTINKYDRYRDDNAWAVSAGESGTQRLIGEEEKPKEGVDVGVKVDLVHAEGQAVLGAAFEAEGAFGDESGVHGSGHAEGWAGGMMEGEAGFGLSEKGLVASAAGTLAVGAGVSANGSLGYGILQAEGSAEAFAGARLTGEASATVGPDGLGVKVGVEAFAGAEATASGSVGIDGAQVGGTITGYAGAGVKFDAGLDISAEKIGFTLDFGVALGLGAGGSIDVAIEPAKLAETVGNFAADSVENVGNFAKDAGDWIGSWF